ncbi:mucin-2-like [Anastrepha ludens]|uniref:mucin-2-like n=1 Tax=Anastrepha ludens TaxID=28586 RepID=UPI0023B1E8DE|nr:mucin-2-like [Anastrepha ludens]
MAHKRVKRDLSYQNNDNTKIVYNIGEILKTDKNPKTLGEPRALEYNTGEILKTEAHQRTLERPKIVAYLNADEKQLETLKGMRPLEHLDEVKYAQSKVDNKPEQDFPHNEDAAVENSSAEQAQTVLESEENMQDSVMEIVTKILEELRGSAEPIEKNGAEQELMQANGTSAEAATSSKLINEVNTHDDTNATTVGQIPDSAADPILETLNNIAALLDMDYDTDANDTTAAQSRQRGTRQLRQYFNGRARYEIQNVPGTHYRSLDAGPYQQQQSSYSFGQYNPYLSPPTTSANYNQLSPGYQVFPQQQQQQRLQSFGGHKQKFNYMAALNPPPPPPPQALIEDDFRPMAANYYRTTTTLRPSTSPKRPNLFNNPELIPYILQSLREYQEQRKKLQRENYQYFHLENQSTAVADGNGGALQTTTVPQTSYYQTTKTPFKSTSNSHFAQFSTMGGFYNNQPSSQQQAELNDYKSTAKYPSKLVSQYSIVDNYIPTTTEGNYFKYNVLANQKNKSYYSTSKPSIHESVFQSGPTVTRYTTTPPPTSNIDIVSAPNLTPFYPTTTTKLPKYNAFSRYPPEMLTFANNSAQMPESYQVFSKVHTTTISPQLKPSRPNSSTLSSTHTPQSSRKPALTLQFNMPEFVASLQSSDLTNMNPQVVNMIKYFKQLNTPHAGRKPVGTSVKTNQGTNPVEQYEEQIEATTEQNRQRPTVAPTKRPVKGYEDFLKSIPNQAHRFNAHSIQQGKPFTSTTSTAVPDYYDEYEEEEEPLGTDTDDDIMPPSQMPPYMPMSETMAPPRSQFMPPTPTTVVSNQPAKSNFQTGFFEATTTRGPFANVQFQQFYQTPTNNQGTKQNNQIPSFINFPSDIFQEIKQRLPPKPQLGSTAPTLTNNLNNIRMTTVRTTTTHTPHTTTTTPATTSTMAETTATTQRMRYTVRPNRHRGQSKWQTSGGSNKELNNVVQGSNSNNNGSKSNKTDFGTQSFRKRPAATPASSALGSLQLNVNMHLDAADNGQRYT